MPKILVVKSYIFVVYSIDILENRRHVHVESKKGRFRVSAKFWLEPEIELVDKGNFGDKEIHEVKKLIAENFETITSQIEKFLRGEKVTPILKTK